MGGQESDSDKLKRTSNRGINTDGINSTNGTTSYAKVLSTSQQPSQKKSPSPTASTLPSNSKSLSTTPKSSATTSQQGKVDKTQWDVAKWFGNGEYLYVDFVKWILLASEEKEISQQNHIERGLNTIKKEIEEMFNANIIDLNICKFCMDLIARCGDIRSMRNIRLSFDENKRNELLDMIFKNLHIEHGRFASLINTLESMSFEQRIVLRFMVHQKIQARIAFLRATLKNHKTTYEYHCISNPYFSEVSKQRKSLQEDINAIKNSNSDLINKYNKLINEHDNLTEELHEKKEELNQKIFEFKKQLEEKDEQLEKSKLQRQLEQLEKNEELKRENAALQKQLEVKDKQLEKSKLQRQLEQLEKNEELKRENAALQKQLETKDELEKSKLQRQLEQLEKNEALKRENIELQKQLEAKDEQHSSQIKDIIENYYSKLTQEREDVTDKTKSEYEEYIKQLQEEAEELRKEAKSAKEEASGYQSALGSATNVRWSDSTFINPIQLTKDIEKFQYSLADFTKVKGRDIKINENGAKQILTSYNCKADIDDTKEIKNYLAAALQRMILEIIFGNAERLYKIANYADSRYFSDEYLESYIVYHSDNLIKYTNLLANREGQDSITTITPVKIRQQVYAALGSRGFVKSNHPFIKKMANEILGKMEKCREVVDEQKKKGLASEAEKIIRTGMQLWFCLKAQEPTPKIQWFESGSRLKTHLMVGSWENENVKELEVDFAFFPLIMTEKDNQVFNKAQVFVRPKQNGKSRLRNMLPF